ncbi:MAG: MarR family winged helix-turn-helix transcriptional regulator [Cyclobacteriaceae bacterium]
MNLNKTKRFGVHLDVTLKLIKQDLLRRFRDNGIDLTPEQWTILSELAGHDAIYQRDLAANTFKDAPTVSRIIELLVKRGYLLREADEEDRRRFLVSLTDEGQKIYEKSAPILYDARTLGWTGLGDKDYDDLTRILGKISSNITKNQS